LENQENQYLEHYSGRNQNHQDYLFNKKTVLRFEVENKWDSASTRFAGTQTGCRADLQGVFM
jgi:hypothetical protein